MKKIAFLLLFCASSLAVANSKCDNPKNDFDDLYCLDKVYQAADKELNDNYQKLQKKLDASGKELLKKGQLAWIEARNSKCSRTEGDMFFVDIECTTNTTVERLRFIQDRLRECSSAGCQNSKL
jgi:uncharacterized protein YecT (DUF1311 family)